MHQPHAPATTAPATGPCKDGGLKLDWDYCENATPTTKSKSARRIGTVEVWGCHSRLLGGSCNDPAALLAIGASKCYSRRTRP
jgi:hypothetical protein